jgi:glycosyltransferase involved in cell wall biosynthesis
MRRAKIGQPGATLSSCNFAGMHILQVTKKLPWPARDGESIAILHLTKGFAAAGHRVTVLAMNTPKHRFDPGFLPEDLRQAADFFAVDVDTSIRAIPAALNLLTRSSYNLERFFSRAFAEGLAQLLRDRDIDLVQLEGLYLAPYFNTIREHSEAPVVMRAHNVEYAIWEKLASGERNPLKRRYLQLLARRLERFERRALSAYDALVPISPVDAQQFKAMGATKPTQVCPVGLPFARYARGEAVPEPMTLGYLGALDWAANREGVDWFLDRVWPQVLAKAPEARFRVAGRNAPPAWLNRKLPGVEFIGEVEDAVDFLGAQQVLVVPLLSGSGMRIKVLEGMATGRPMVATAQAAEGIAVRDGEHLLLRDAPEAMAQGILGLLKDPRQAETLGSSGRTLVKDAYDAEDIVYRLLSFYQNKLLQARPVTS